MNAGVDRMLASDARNEGRVLYLPLVERNRRIERFAVAAIQIVENDDVLAAPAEKIDGDAPDVARAAGDENCHKFH